MRAVRAVVGMELALDIANYSLGAWPTYEQTWITRDSYLCWGGTRAIRRRLTGQERKVLRSFANLVLSISEARLRKKVEGLARRFGPLGLCQSHQLPVAHLPAPVLRHVAASLDRTYPEGGPWARLCSCDIQAPNRSRQHSFGGTTTRSVVVEPLARWTEWSNITAGLIAIAARLQFGRPASRDQWRQVASITPFDAQVVLDWPDRTHDCRSGGRTRTDQDDVPVFNLADGEAPTLVTVTHPTTKRAVKISSTSGQASAITKHLEHEKVELLRQQHRLFETVLNNLVHLVGFTPQLRWDEPCATITYAGRTFLGALVAQLLLSVGGVNAFAVCDYCRAVFDPGDRWPRSGEKDHIFCPKHSNPTDRRRLTRRTGGS